MRFTFIALEDRVVRIAGTDVARPRFEVRAGDRVLGIVEGPAWRARGGWAAILPAGTRTEFLLPSRKQAAEWLAGAQGPV